jgi:hypothetical protein
MQTPRVGTSPKPLVETLAAFNRTERFLLVGWALGKPAFELDAHFRTILGDKCGLTIPTGCFVAMDFHLDWLYAALEWWAGRAQPEQLMDRPAAGAVTGTIQDVDLLVAFTEEGGRHHLILIEAKGFTGTDNAQLRSKAQRLSAIFRDAERRYPEIDAHFVLVGPRPSVGLSTIDWPAWMRREGDVHFVALDDPGPKFKVTRRDAGGEPTSSVWSHWRIDPDPWPGVTATFDEGASPES